MPIEMYKEYLGFVCTKCYWVDAYRLDRMFDMTYGVTSFLKKKGYRKVTYEAEWAREIWARKPWAYWCILANFFCVDVYWYVISWLYSNTYLFHRVPIGVKFSWKYLTVYQWCLQLSKRIKSNG